MLSVSLEPAPISPCALKQSSDSGLEAELCSRQSNPWSLECLPKA